ncbi:MAG: hypothetical protein ACOX2R_03330 [Anaerolineae bacterium]|jgi:hypothetical protein
MSTFAELVERRFQFLKDRGFHVTRRIVYPSHDDAEVVYDSSRCRIRLFRDRSIVDVDLASPIPSGVWFDLGTVIYYLTDGQDQTWDFPVPAMESNEQRSDWQLRRLAEVLTPYLDRACQFFDETPADTVKQRLMDAMHERLTKKSSTS